MVWIIWNARNNQIFNNTYTFPIQIFGKASMYIPKFNCFSFRYCGSYLLSYHLPSLLVSWVPPLLGIIKVNFDGSMTSSAAAATYVIRDQHTSFIHCGGKLLYHVLVSFVELIATWLGLHATICDLNITHILLEGDLAIISHG